MSFYIRQQQLLIKIYPYNNLKGNILYPLNLEDTSQVCSLKPLYHLYYVAYGFRNGFYL